MALRARSMTMFGLSAILCGGTATGADAFRVDPVVERRIGQLPPGPLYWRVEIFPSLREAQAAAGPTSLAAEVADRAWLFTLGNRARRGAGGRFVAEIGPVPVTPAPRYLLRVNRAGGPPGAATPVHSHPGSEAFHVLSGRLCQRTAHGVARLDAGASMNGHQPGIAMQLVSCGATDLDQLVMFLVDDTKPFSSPASLR